MSSSAARTARSFFSSPTNAEQHGRPGSWLWEERRSNSSSDSVSERESKVQDSEPEGPEDDEVVA